MPPNKFKPPISPGEAAKNWPSSSNLAGRHNQIEVQPLQSFFAKNAQPGEVTNINLSGGQARSYFFSLGVNSTVPFVRLEGAGGVQKEFSWGETVEIPPGVVCNVRNASKHRGDIQIQSGTDYAVPAAIRFPVEFPAITLAFHPVGTRVFLTSPIDTRRVRRAWLVFSDQFIFPEAVGTDIYVLGYYEQHTAGPTSSPALAGPEIPDPSWLSNYFWPPFQAIGAFPLGYNASMFDFDSTMAMLLPDYLRVVLIMPAAVVADLPLVDVYAILEYL